MPLISKTISNLIGGISQQAATVRLEGQCEDSLNGIPSIVEGWKKRKGTAYIGKLYPHAGTNTKIHCTEREIIAVTDKAIDIFGLDGTKQQTIDTTSVDGYMNGAKTPLMKTVADTTFILNKAVKPQMTNDTVADQYPGRALIHVKQVNWDTTYQVINSAGTIIASCTSPDGVVDPNAEGSKTRTLTAFNNGIRITSTDTNMDKLRILPGVPATTDGDGNSVPAMADVARKIGNVLMYYMPLNGSATTSQLAAAINRLGDAAITAALISNTAIATGEYQFTAATNPEAGDANPKWLDFSYIAENLASQIPGASCKKNVILMPAGDYSVTDSQNGQFLIYVKQKITAFSDLPTVAPNGFTVEITNGSSSSAGNYHVKAVTKDKSAFGDCLWEECTAVGIKKKIDPATMPHILVRQSDGTFVYKQAPWEERQTGDDLTNPLPTFIGKNINDIFYYKNRLGFLADENVIMSRASEPYAFFFSTVQTLADNEPIDAAGSHHKTVILRHALALSEKLYIFGENAQFVLNEGDAILSPKTASIDTLTEYVADIETAPVSSGRSIFFPTRNTQWEGLYEGLISDDIFQATSVTSHVSALIPAGLNFLIASPNAEAVVLSSPQNPETLYLYKYTWAGTEKVQSAWSRLTFQGKIHTAFFINTLLYLCTATDDGLHLETVDFDEGKSETSWCLDRHIDAEKLTTTTDGVTTVITLPYGVSEKQEKLPELLLANGKLVQTQYHGPNQIKTSENLNSGIICLGYRYSAEYTFSELTFVPSGQRTALTQGRLQIRKLWVIFTSGSHFVIEVTPLYRETYKNHYQCVLGSGEAVIGQLYKADGKFDAPVMSKNNQVQIKLTTDSILPLCLVSAGWEGYYVCRSSPA